jgi:outer membrane protein TolC
MPRTRGAPLWLGLAVVLAGCSPRLAKPLTAQAIDAALSPPAMDVLRVQARSIQHPLLQPLDIDGRNGLSPSEVAILAVLANPSLRAVRDERGMAAAQVLQAGLLPNPSLSWTNEFPFAGPDHLVAYAIGVGWDVGALINRSARIDGAKAQAASVDLDIAWREWQVAQGAKTTAYAILSLQAQLEVAGQANKLLQDNLKTVQEAVDMQQKTAVDLSAAQAAQQEAQSTVLGLQRDLARQRLALNRLLGLPSQTQVRLRSEEDSLPPEVPTAAEVQRGLEDRRLDLLALRRGYDSQEAAVRAAVLSRFPRMSVGTSRGRDTAGSCTFGYDVSLDLPLFDFNQGNIAMEEATRQRLFDEFVNRVFEARNDIAALLEEIQSLNRQIASAESAVSVLARLVADYGKAVNTRNADVLSYYSARNDLDKKRIEVLKLKQELVDAWVGLENASGRCLFVQPAPLATAASQPAPQGVTS